MSNPFNITIKEGEVFLNDERMIITSSSTFSTLKKDLIDNIGIDRVKGFLLRYGWNLGVNDARKSLSQRFPTIKELLRQGPILHMMQGYTKVKTTNLQIEMIDSNKVKSVIVEGEWRNSYEAAFSHREIDSSIEPACYTLVGYASGFYSTICKHEVWFKEVTCIAEGATVCKYIGKSLHLWDKETQLEKRYLQNNKIVDELAVTYEKLLDERNNLSKVLNIHDRLTEEMINGNDLKSLARVVFQIINTPILIKSGDHNQYFTFGLSSKEANEIRQWFEKCENLDNAKTESILIPEKNTEILVTAILLQNKVYGYCAFIFKGVMSDKIDKMILERVSAVCSLYFLNEKTSFESLERRKGFFLEQILNGEFSSIDEIIKNSRYLDSSINQTFCIAALDLKHKLKSESLFFIHQQVLEETYYYFRKTQLSILSTIRDGYIVLLIPVELTYQEGFFQTFLAHISSVFSEYRFKLGLSSVCNELENAFQIYKEAITAVKMNKENETVVRFEDIDLLETLIHTGGSYVITQKAKKILNPLLIQDEPKKTELLRTLYQFLQYGGNLEKTMSMLSISMSGLRYRIKKIEELLKCDIRNPKISIHLYASIEILQNENIINLS